MALRPRGGVVPWVKLDDRFWRHRKIRKAWKVNRAAIGLHVMAICYCNEEENDGFVDPEWVEERTPRDASATRDLLVGVLVDAGLWEPFNDGWQIHDYLEYQPSSAKLAGVRESRRLSGSLGGKRANGKQL